MMTSDELRAKFEEAKASLFALEEAIGPVVHKARRSVYSLRVQLGYIEAELAQLRAFPDETKEPT